MREIWEEVDDFLAKHQDDYKMGFGLEYSSIIGWVVDFTPRKNHPKARMYGEVISIQRENREAAIKEALVVAKEVFG
jgi:hypothetical protein